MNRAIFFTLMLTPLAAASSFAQPSPPSALTKIRAEAAQAENEARRLSTAAGQARGESARLAADRLTAGAAIAAAEAQISVMDAELAVREALVRANEERLSAKQAPAAALVAGLVNLGRRPPLVSLADERDLSGMVRMRSLLEVAVPRIRAESAGLSADLAASRMLAEKARLARSDLASARVALAKRQQAFAALEKKALDRAATLDAGAIGADDRMTIASEGAATLGNQWERDRAGRRLAQALAAFPPAPRRPFPPERVGEASPFVITLPVDAPVIDGLGQISASGIRSRGTTFATRVDAPVLAPTDGVILFAGPYRRHDGIMVIDHGGGWMSLLIGVRSSVTEGARVVRGAPIGRALGPVTLELSIKGRPRSAVLLAGSS
ncbi:MAG: peptidoglycan DD-metalloendopeptidase family protein [Pseudomonadota bacterium]